MTPPSESGRRYQPFVPENMKMKEFTWRALVLGLIAMAVLRIGKGTILEENIARTAGSIGESVAAGAVFTLPAFYLVHAWAPPVIDKSLGFWGRLWALAADPNYLKATSLMIVGSVLGVLFVSLIRR